MLLLFVFNQRIRELRSLDFWVGVDYVVDLLFFTDMYLNYMHFAFDVEGEVIMNQKEIQKHYISG